MMAKTKEMATPISLRIKGAMMELQNKDGLKRTQRWLARLINMGEVELSNKLSDNSFTKEEIEKINEILGTNF